MNFILYLHGYKQQTLFFLGNASLCKKRIKREKNNFILHLHGYKQQSLFFLGNGSEWEFAQKRIQRKKIMNFIFYLHGYKQHKKNDKKVKKKTRNKI